MSTRRLATTLAAFALVLGGSVVAAAPASAGELVYQDGGPGGCFTVRKQHDAIGNPQVTVWWHCEDAKKVKVIWRYGKDSGCNSMSVINTKFSDSSGQGAKFDRLVLC